MRNVDRQPKYETQRAKHSQFYLVLFYTIRVMDSDHRVLIDPLKNLGSFLNQPVYSLTGRHKTNRHYPNPNSSANNFEARQSGKHKGERGERDSIEEDAGDGKAENVRSSRACCGRFLPNRWCWSVFLLNCVYAQVYEW